MGLALTDYPVATGNSRPERPVGMSWGNERPGRKRNPLLEWHCDDHTDLGKDQGVPEHRTVQFAQQICVIGQRARTGIRTDVQLPE